MNDVFADISAAFPAAIYLELCADRAFQTSRSRGLSIGGRRWSHRVQDQSLAVHGRPGDFRRRDPFTSGVYR